MSLVPFDDRDGWIWLDGQFTPWREAKVHVLTHGLHYASAVFEGERMYGGVIFRGLEHTQRLFKSAEIMDMKIPFSVEEIDKAKGETCAKNGLDDCYVRPIAWRGSESISVSAQASQPMVDLQLTASNQGSTFGGTPKVWFLLACGPGQPEAGIVRGKSDNGAIRASIPNPRTLQGHAGAPATGNHCDLQVRASDTSGIDSNVLTTTFDFK